jgi:hypothetical protein
MGAGGVNFFFLKNDMDECDKGKEMSLMEWVSIFFFFFFIAAGLYFGKNVAVLKSPNSEP